jgi:hypothetical protein
VAKPKPAAEPGKRKPVDWVRVRAVYEAGGPDASFRALGAAFGVSHTAVRQRCDREEWRQDLEPAIRNAVTAKVSGVVSTGNPEKTAAAIESEADRRVAVIERHRGEWEECRERILSGLRAHKAAGSRVGPDGKPDPLERMAGKREAFEDLKAAKIAAEALQIVQAGERRAHRLDEPPVEPPGQPRRVIVEYTDSVPAHLAEPDE